MLSTLSAAPASASSMGYGLLLSNYTSGFTVSTVEQGGPSCVNNQGDPGTASQTDGPGTASNIDVEFTTQNIGNCKPGNNSWVYPFVLTANGYTSNTWNLVSSHNTTNNCSTGSTSSIAEIGLAGLTPCVSSNGPGDIGPEAAYTGQPAVLTPPTSYGFYAVMTPYPGPAGDPDPPPVGPCTASNWNSCVAIEVYDNGDGPYATQTAAAAGKSSAAAKRTPSLSRPVVTKIRRHGRWRIRVKVTGRFGPAPAALLARYGARRLRRSAYVAVRAIAAGGQVRRSAGQSRLHVRQRPERTAVTTLFSKQDSAAILRKLRAHRPIVFRADGFEVTADPHESFVTEARSAQTKSRPPRCSQRSRARA